MASKEGRAGGIRGGSCTLSVCFFFFVEVGASFHFHGSSGSCYGSSRRFFRSGGLHEKYVEVPIMEIINLLKACMDAFICLLEKNIFCKTGGGGGGVSSVCV